MCGIAGIANFSGLNQVDAVEKVRRMTSALAHRGPDADGFFTDDIVSLGHRRLSIIDLSAGQQPMSVANGDVQVVFNGEIYNFLDVRVELEAIGHSFATQSDTEVLLISYLEWGVEFLKHLNGMFALALWDRRQNRLLLARDRVGKKPLYYKIDGDSLVFASELKSLVAAGSTSGELNREALDCYLTLGYVPAPLTIYSDVRKLEPATVLTVTAGALRETRYWSLGHEPRMECSLDEATEEFQPILRDAVSRRLISDVPLGAFLSGGIDSSLVVSEMSGQLSSPVLTHTIGFDEDELNEMREARLIADHLGTDHKEYVVLPDAAEVLPAIARHFDEPFADSSALPTWYVCQMTRESVTVALSGDGGDEAFAGYTFRYLPHSMESSIRGTLPAWARHLVFASLGAVWPRSARLPRWLRLRTIFENLAVSDAEAFFKDLSTLRSDDRESIYRPEFLGSLQGFSAIETVIGKYVNNDAPTPLSRAQFADINHYMTDDILVKVDRMSMAHSLEVRAPLLDMHVLEFAARLPDSVKMNRRNGKLVLRNAVRQRVPQSIYGLPKRGFAVPASEWLRTDLKDLAESLLFERFGTIAETLEPVRLKSHWQEHLSGQRDHGQFFWSLLMLGLWDRECNSSVSADGGPVRVAAGGHAV